MGKPDLSVVIPSYDEMANLQKGVLDKVEHFLERSKGDYEVIVVDDGSKDGSAEFVEKFTKENKKFKLLRNPHTGKAGAVTAGMLAAKGKYVLFTDMDQAVPIEEVEKLLPNFSQGYDIVIGSRTGRKGAPISRAIMSKASVILRKLIVGLSDISDTQCGFKMFTEESSSRIFHKISDLHGGFKTISGSNVTSGFDVELLFLAKQMGFKIKEVPIKWLYVETRRVNPIKDSIDGVLDLITIKMNGFSQKYK